MGGGVDSEVKCRRIQRMGCTALLRFLQFGSEGLFLTPAGTPGPPSANHFVPLSHTHLPLLPMSCCFNGGHNTLFLAGGSHPPPGQQHVGVQLERPQNSFFKSGQRGFL